MSRLTRNCLSVSLLALAVWMVSCAKTEKAAEKKAGEQRTFASPSDAGSALVEAAKADDQNTLLAIFGPEGKQLLASGDPVKDKNVREMFVAAYNEMHRWGKV